MTLRIMLVGLVASLGFELPSGPDVSSWAQAGQAWVRARMLDPSGPSVEPTARPGGPADCHQVDETFEVPPSACEKEAAAVDAAFRVASEGVAAELSADLLATRREEPAAGRSSEVVARPPRSARATARRSAAWSSPPTRRGRPRSPESSRRQPTSNRPVEPSPSGRRPDRVSSAVRLTREASRPGRP